MIFNLIKKLLCNHDWEKIRFSSFYWDGDWSHNYTEYYACKCSKCGRRKVIPFEVDVNSFEDHPGKEEMMGISSRVVEQPCIRCGKPVRVAQAYDKKTSQYVIIEPPICEVCSARNRVVDSVKQK